jgi:CheY-like chemotaxis protein
MARLLIVEDHPELASLMVAAAESRGHEATAVHTGEAALALLRPAAFHAAVVDLLLPDMRGSTVLSALRDNAIPAVAVSGVFKGDRFAREATEVHGARAFFEKPFELLHLLESLEQLCGLTRPLTPLPADEDEEVVVFEDASLLDMEDEPIFAPSEDEPDFDSPTEEHAPVVQGLAVEEAGDPLGDEPLAPPPVQDAGPAPMTRDVEPPATESIELSVTPVIRTEDLEELGALEALEAEEEPAAPEAPVDEEEHAALEALAPAEEQTAPATQAVAPAEEDQALEALAPAEEQTAPAAPAAAPAEEDQALEALAPAEEQTAPAAPAYTEEYVARSALESAEEKQALEALGPAEETSAPAATAPGASETPEPEPGIALPFGEREKVWNKPADAGTHRRPPPDWSLSGDLKNTSVPRLLNAYYEARHSGELKLRQGSVLKVVYFEAGRPVYAASNLAHERFARFCVRRGVLPEAKLQEVLTLAREQNLRTSEAMMRLGLLDAKRHPRLVEEQVKELLWSTFSWKEGAFGFSPKRPPSTGLVKLSVFPGDLILEGILRSEPLESLRENMPRSRRLFPTAAPPYALHELKLKGPQALLLAYTDGSKTVADLLTLTELPERGVLATLRGLELIGVLEERRDEPTNRRRISFGL